MENLLLTHTFIEMFYNNSIGSLLYEHQMDDVYKKDIFEKYGLTNGFEETANMIAGIVFDKHEPQTIEVNSKYIDFIDKILIRLDRTRINPATYSHDESTLNTDGTFSKVVIYVKLPVGGFSYLVGNIMHELVHAKQDHDLMEKGSSLPDENAKIGYRKTVDMPPINDIVKEISDLLYCLNQYERGAYVAMLQGEILKVKDKVFPSIDEAVDFLRNTEPYLTYLKIKEYVDKYTNRFYSDSFKQQILEIVNKISDYNFKTFNDFRKWATTRVDKTIFKMENVMPKIAADMMNVARMTGHKKIV